MQFVGTQLLTLGPSTQYWLVMILNGRTKTNSIVSSFPLLLREQKSTYTGFRVTARRLEGNSIKFYSILFI